METFAKKENSTEVNKIAQRDESFIGLELSEHPWLSGTVISRLNGVQNLYQNSFT